MLLDGVSVRYHRRGPWVLRAVDVHVEPGEAVVVLGRNGAGKSTLLQVAAGVVRPDRGVVRHRPAVVGWVPERFPADQPCTVGRYLLGMGRSRGLSTTMANRAVDDWVDRLGLAPYRDIRLPELSKGTAQKVGLAQAMLRVPGLLILDEPWEGLDAQTRDLVPELVREVCGAGGAVLVSDHRGETARLPDARRWTVADGTVVESTAPDGGRLAVIEVAVPAEQATGTANELREAGYQVLRVRLDDAVEAGS